MPKPTDLAHLTTMEERIDRLEGLLDELADHLSRCPATTTDERARAEALRVERVSELIVRRSE